MDITTNVINFITNKTVIFYLAVVILLYIFRGKFQFQGFIALLRTKFGLKLMDSWAKKFNKPLKILAKIGIGVGALGGVLSILLIMSATVNMLKAPEPLDGSPVVLPGTTIAGTNGLEFPIIIGVLSLFIIIVVHEFAHGVIARAYNIPVKSSGVMIMGPLLGAFVEPDDKVMDKKSDTAQHSVFAAGPFSNILLTIAVLALIFYALVPAIVNMTDTIGIEVVPQAEKAAFAAGLNETKIITSVNGVETMNYSSFINEVINLTPGEEITLSNSKESYTIVAGAHPDNESRGYMGINLAEKRVVKYDFFGASILYEFLKWLNELLFWVWFISLNIGIINLYPVYITDGARMLKTFFLRVIKNENKAIAWWAYINRICLFMLLFVILFPALVWVWEKIAMFI